MKKSTLRLAQTALLAALSFVAFTFLQIKIPAPGGNFTSIHMGNIFCVLAALLLGGVHGGLAGAIGMTLADIMDPIYITVAPKTFILKLCIGLIVGQIAHNIANISQSNNKGYIFRWSTIAAIAGMAFNVIADPLVGYFYKLYILGQPQNFAEALAKLSAGVTLFNAIVTVIIASWAYNLIRPILKRSNLLIDIPKYN